MLAIVTQPELLYETGQLRGTLYLIPETLGDAQRKAEYNLMVAEAEQARETDKYGASLRIQAAYRFLITMLTKADFISIDEVMKPEYNFGRIYALGMLGKLLRGALPARQLKEFKREKYRRIQQARFAVKSLVDKGLAEQWAKDVAAGKWS